MPQGLSAHRPTAYQAWPGGRPVSRQTGPCAQKNIPASLLEGPSAAGSAAPPRAEAMDGSPGSSMDGSGAIAAPVAAPVSPRRRVGCPPFPARVQLLHRSVQSRLACHGLLALALSPALASLMGMSSNTGWRSASAMNSPTRESLLAWK